MKECNVPTKEIKQDIADTQAEINTMEREEKGFRLLDDRLSGMKADHRRAGIQQRTLFILNLEDILRERDADKNGD